MPRRLSDLFRKTNLAIEVFLNRGNINPMSIKIFLILSLVYISGAALAGNLGNTVNRNLLYTDRLLNNFDGVNFLSGLSDTPQTQSQIKAYLNANRPGHTYEQGKDKLNLVFKTENERFVLESEAERFSGEKGRRVNQSWYWRQKEDDKTAHKLHLSSISFVGEKIRSATDCQGSRSIGTKFKMEQFEDELDCVAVTPRICQRVLNAYEQVSKKNGQMDSLDVMKKKVDECSDVLKGYADIVGALVDDKNEGNDREKLIASAELRGIEETQISTLGNPVFNSVKIKSLNFSIDQKNANLAWHTSARGIKQIHQMIDLCERNLPFFTPDQFLGGDAPKATSKAPPRLTK